MSKRAPKSVTPANPWVAAFKAGTHTDMSGTTVTFSEADITALAERVQSQTSGGFTPPLVVGHPRHDSPRVGSVVDAKAEGGTLYLKVDELVPEFAESCRKGEYKYTSVSLYKDGGLRHLGVLGGQNPAVKGLEPIAFGEGMFAEPDALVSGPGDVLQFAATVDLQSSVATALDRMAWRLRDVGRIFRGMRDALIASSGVEAADLQIPNWLITDLENTEAPDLAVPTPSFSDPTDPVPPKPPVDPAGGPVPAPPEPKVDPNAGPESTPSARELELAAENERLRKAITEREEAQTKKAFCDRLEAMEASGHLLPTQRTRLEALYSALHDGGHSFAEDDPVKVHLDALLAAFPKQVEFGELPNGDSSVPDAAAKAREITELMDEAERNGRSLSFSEATTQVTNRRSSNGR